MALFNRRPYEKPVVNPVKKEPTSALGKLFIGGGLLGSTPKKTPATPNFTPKPVIPTFSGPTSKEPKVAPMPAFTSDSSKKTLPVAPKAPVAPVAQMAPVDNPNINILGQDITPKPEKQLTLREKIAGAGLALQKGSSVYDSLLQQSRSLREQAAARQKALEAAYAPSAQEQNLQRQIADLTTSAEQGIAGLEGQGRGIPLGLVRGQQAKLEEQANIRLGGLGRALTAEQAIREGNIAAAQAGLEALTAEQEAAIQEAQIEQMAKTDARSQQINQALALAPGKNSIEKYQALVNEGLIEAVDVPEVLQEFVFSVPEVQSPIGVSPGETLYDPNTGEVLYQAPFKPSASSSGGVSYSGSGKISDQAQAVINGTLNLEDLTPTQRGKIAGELAAAGYSRTATVNAGQREQIAGFDDLKRQALEGLGMVENNQLNVGPVASRIKKAGAAFGFQPEFTAYRSVIDNINSTLFKLRSGAAVTPSEAERLTGFVPNVNDDEKTAKIKLNKFFNELDNVQKNYVQRATQSSKSIQQEFAGTADPLGIR